MTRDHYDESFFFSFPLRSIVYRSRANRRIFWIFFPPLPPFFIVVQASRSRFKCSPLFLSLCSPSLPPSLSLDVSLLLTSSRGRDSRLINAWNEILKERVLCLNIAPIRRGVWLLFFTERSVQTSMLCNVLSPDCCLVVRTRTMPKLEHSQSTPVSPEEKQ